MPLAQRHEMHIKVVDGLAELWGGLVNCLGNNILPLSEELLRSDSAVLRVYWQREGDDGAVWGKMLILARVEIVGVVRDGDAAHALLPLGDWLVIEQGGFDLALSAHDAGVLLDDITEPPHQRIFAFRLRIVPVVQVTSGPAVLEVKRPFPYGGSQSEGHADDTPQPL